MDASSSRITGGPFPETRPQATQVTQATQATPETQPARLTQAVEKQGDSQSQSAEAALNPPASEGPKAAPLASVEERQGEQSTTENAGQAANPVEPSKIAAVSPAVNATQNIRETAQDQVVETKVPPGDPAAMQGPKTEPVHAEPAPVKLPSATRGASKTTSAAVKKPVSPKLPQSPGDAGTKQVLKTAKAETAVKNSPARFGTISPARCRQWNRCRSAEPAQTGAATGAQVARTGSASQECHPEHVCFNACLLSETRGKMDKHKRSQKKGRSGDLLRSKGGGDNPGWGDFQLYGSTFL